MSRWIIFFSIFLSIYGSLHLYLLIKVRRAYYLESWGYFLIVAALLFLMLAPIQARALESQHQTILALIMFWIAYLWMGCLFIWLWLSLALDAYHLCVTLFQRLFAADWIHLMLSRRQSLTLTILVTFALMIYGAYSAQIIRTEHLTLRSPKLGSAMKRLRLVQISDVHLGQVIFPGRLERIIQAVNAAEPDLFLSTGDLVDGPLYDKNSVLQKFKSIKAPLGKFAVTGNHEAYAGMQYATEFTKSAGFTLLQGTSVAVADGITIAGVDDPAVAKAEAVQEATLLAGIPEADYKILLKHQPRVASQSMGFFDLQLSGHTHQGQIFPFHLIVRRVYPLFSGLYPQPEGGQVYVNRGTGTWGPPVRLWAPPEVTIIDLLPATTEDEADTPTQTEDLQTKEKIQPPKMKE